MGSEEEEPGDEKLECGVGPSAAGAAGKGEGVHWECDCQQSRHPWGMSHL